MKKGMSDSAFVVWLLSSDLCTAVSLAVFNELGES